VQDRAKVTITEIGSRICAFGWHQIHRPWMTLNGGNAPLAETNKNSGAHQQNFNEDRPISLVGKCRPMHLPAINIKCMRICAGVPSGEGDNKCKRLAVLQRGEFIGTRRCGLLVTKLFAALGLRDTEDCQDISRYQILR